MKKCTACGSAFFLWSDLAPNRFCVVCGHPAQPGLVARESTPAQREGVRRSVVRGTSILFAMLVAIAFSYAAFAQGFLDAKLFVLALLAFIVGSQLFMLVARYLLRCPVCRGRNWLGSGMISFEWTPPHCQRCGAKLR